MDVVVVCRSQKKMRAKTASILDAFLYRIGDRTWRGQCSRECLQRISKELRSVASRNMAVAVYRSGSKEEHQKPLFVVGSRSRFGAGARCPISVKTLPVRSQKTRIESFARALVEIAVLFHDVGKATNMFQRKIKLAAEGGRPQADAVRHEVFSTLVLKHILGGAISVSEVAGRLLDCSESPDLIDRACALAADECLDLHSSENPEMEIISQKDLGDVSGIRAQLLLLVLSHHRLADIDHLVCSIMARNHVTFGECIPKDSFEISEDGNPFWTEKWFLEKLSALARSLEEMDPGSYLAGWDFFGRFPLMMADHIGSSLKEPGAVDGHLANTSQDGGPADSLSKHVWRVSKETRPMVAGVFRQRWQFPVIDEYDMSSTIQNLTFRGNRFDWQVSAAQEAGRICSEAEGGFFGALIAGTGSGKTRAASMIMAALSSRDAQRDRRGLRFNLALPLRTLARQSGREYVEDLGFRPEDVATFVGGSSVSWKDEAEVTGSEDRLLGFDMNEVTDFSDEDFDLDLGSLGGARERRLPDFAERLCRAAGQGSAKMSRFLTAPILVSTIDHLMSAASPIRGGHIDQMIRASSADLVIDELDQFSEEDLSAVQRLIYLVGVSGRRVLVMSATLPRDIIESFGETYDKGYAVFAQMTGSAQKVHFLCAGEQPGSCISSDGVSTMIEAYDTSVEEISKSRSSAGSIQVAKILSRPENWRDQVKIVSGAIDQLHQEHSFDVDGISVSVGLVRITRVAHLQSLAVSIGECESNNALREFVVLHASMPQVRRSYIEEQLGKLLRRKGPYPNKAISAFVRSHRLLERAKEEGRSSVQIVVLSSAVIETGNDVDFDWLITDPSSIRSVIQASGRVNRHRREAVSTPNVMILGEYLVSLETGLMERPGPETKPAPETCVSQFKLSMGRSSVSLFATSASFAVDSSLVMERPVPFALAEAETRKRFLAESRRDRASELFAWSSKYGTKHRFRRETSREIQSFGQVDSGEVSWRFFPSKRSSDTTEVFLTTRKKSLMDCGVLFGDDLADLLKRTSSFREGRLLKHCSLALPDSAGVSEGRRPVLDPVLGVLRKVYPGLGVEI